MNTDTPEEITSTDLEFQDASGDAGVSFLFHCPTCGDGLQLATSQWWEADCSCPRRWTLSITASGWKIDK